MHESSYIWHRANEDVKFRGFSDQEIAVLTPALVRTDLALKDTKKLNATFKKGQPRLTAWSSKVAAETRYPRLLPNAKATVYMNPKVFEGDRWNPSGVAAHEIGHLVGPTRNTSIRERQAFRKAFGYKQKQTYHELAPEKWKARRNNPVRKDKTRQSVSASEDFAETFRAITGEPFTNRVHNDYFKVTMTPQRVNYMKRYYLK